MVVGDETPKAPHEKHLETNPRVVCSMVSACMFCMYEVSMNPQPDHEFRRLRLHKKHTLPELVMV